MKLLGQLLLWIGFLSGSLATVYNAPAKGVEFVKGLTPESKEVAGFDLPDLSAIDVPEDGWSLIPWLWYGISAVACLAGAVILLSGKLAKGEKNQASAASLTEITKCLNRLIANVGHLAKEIDDLPPSKIVHRVDHVLADDLRDFAEGRESITVEYGLNVFADVMSQFAAGERAVNRAWSASADGYVDEAATCIRRAEAMFEGAKQLLDDAAKS